MTSEEAKSFLIAISYKLGNMAVEYLTEKDGKKMREAIKVLEQQPCEDTEVIKVSKGAVKARQGRFVIYDIFWLKENFYTTEEKIYGQPKQPCEDCISREAVIDHICEDKECYKEECKGRTLKRCIDLQWVFDLPSVTPQRPKAKWIIHPIDCHLACSKCLTRAPYDCKTNFCPVCGAEMGGADDDAFSY